MYTPRGELNEALLQVLYQDGIWEELKSCQNKEQLTGILGKYRESISEEEVMESLTVIQSYLEEEQEIRLLSDLELDEVAGGVQRTRVFCKNEVMGLLERYPEAPGILQGIFSVLRK